MHNRVLAPTGEIYGLVVASDVDLPHLLPHDPSLNAKSGSQPDVTIRQQALDWFDPSNPPAMNDHLLGNEHDLWINVPEKLVMRITNGTSISYDLRSNLAPVELRAFLLGTGLGGILIQRGSLVLHGNALCKQGEPAIVCVGASGAGKSTVAAAMMQRGYHVLADDVCPIDPDGLVRHGIQRIKLWDDAADRLGITTHGLEKVPGNRAKWSVPFEPAPDTASRTPCLIVWLDPIDSDDFLVTRLTGAAKFAAIRNNIYRNMLYRALDREARCLQRISEICQTAEVVRLCRPRDCFKIDELVDKLIELQAFCRRQDDI